MIFTYWEDDVADLRDFVAAWSRLDDDVRVYTQHDVMERLENPYECSRFNRLRIPAARADIAPFVLLRAHGGFYVAPSVAPGNPSAVRALLNHLSSFEYVTFINDEYPGRGVPKVLSFAALSREDCYLPEAVLNAIFGNLAAHDNREAKSREPVDYRLEEMTGSVNVATRLFSATSTGFEVKPFFRGKVRVEAVSGATGHPAFSSVEAMVNRPSGGTLAAPLPSEPLLSHRRWEDDEFRQIFFDLVTPPHVPDAQSLWNKTREEIVMTGPAEKSDVGIINHIIYALEMLVVTRTTRFPSTRGEQDIADEIAYWEGVYESHLDEYLMILKTRSLQCS